MNVVLTCGLIVVGATIGMILTAPDFAVLPIVIGLVIGALVVPVVLYPVTYTLWQALDLAMRPPDAEELATWSVRALLLDVDLPEIDDPASDRRGMDLPDADPSTVDEAGPAAGDDDDPGTA